MFINVCFLHIYLIHVVKKFCACILVFALSPLSLLVLFYHSFNFFGMLPALACMKKSNITNMPTLELPPSHSTFATLPRFGLFIRVEKKWCSKVFQTGSLPTPVSAQKAPTRSPPTPSVATPTAPLLFHLIMLRWSKSYFDEENHTILRPSKSSSFAISNKKRQSIEVSSVQNPHV